MMFEKWRKNTEIDYARPSFVRDLIDRMVQRNILGRRIKIEIILKPDVLPGVGKYIRTENWTNESLEDLSVKGYKKCTGFKDSIVWMDVPCYVKIINGREADVSDTHMDTAVTLNDNMSSNATADFVKGMSKGTHSTMDVQKMIMIAIVGVGAFFGLKMLGVF